MTSKYSVSILVLIRGQSDYLGECISALGSLKYSNFEPRAIFINDGASSKDYYTFQNILTVFQRLRIPRMGAERIESSLNMVLNS